MLEVNEICERLLAQPGPPPASPEEMLGLAKRDRRRRRSAGAAGAVLLVTASMFTTFWVLTPAPPPASPSTISISTSPERRFRLGDSPMNERMIAALVAALPPGVAIVHYTGGKSEDSSPGTDSSWDVSVSFSNAEFITVDVFRKRHMPVDPKHRADPCRIELMKAPQWKPPRQCEVITIGQQRIGAGVADSDVDTWFALRHYGDWTIMVTQRGRAVLSTGELAALVSNAAFEPI